MRILKKVIAGTVALILLLVLLCVGYILGNVYIWNSGVNERVIFPEDLRGFAGIIYDVPDAPELRKEKGRVVIEFPEDGILRTSSELNLGWKKIDFYRVKGSNLVEMKSFSAGPVPEDVPGEEIIVRGGGTHYVGNSPPVILYFVGNAEDRENIDWSTSSEWIGSALAIDYEAQQDGARNGE